MSIWYNSLIRIENKPFFWKEKFDRGLFKVSQLYENGSLISIKKAAERYGLSFIEFNAIVSAIPKDTRNYLKSGCQMVWHSNFAELIDHKDIAKLVYCELLKKKDDTKVVNIVKRWNNTPKINITIDLLYKSISRIFQISNIPKLRSFQYRLALKGIVTNVHLAKWKIISSNQCYFCDSHVETVEHLFYSCDRIKCIWDATLDFIRERTGSRVALNHISCIFNTVHDNPLHLANFVCLVTKQYLYKTKCLKRTLNKHNLLSELLYYENIEKYIAVKHNKLSVHNTKWYTDLH